MAVAYEIHVPDEGVFGPYSVSKKDARERARGVLGVLRLPNGTKTVRVELPDNPPPPGPFEVVTVKCPLWTPEALDHAQFQELEAAKEALEYELLYMVQCKTTGRTWGSHNTKTAAKKSIKQLKEAS